MTPPTIWFSIPVGIHGEAGAERLVDVLDGDLAGLLVHLDVGDRGGLGVLASLSAFDQATPRPLTTFASDRFEAGTRGCQLAALVDGVHHREQLIRSRRAAASGDVLHPERDRVHVRRAWRARRSPARRRTSVCGRLPARNQCALTQLSLSGSDFSR